MRETIGQSEKLGKFWAILFFYDFSCIHASHESSACIWLSVEPKNWDLSYVFFFVFFSVYSDQSPGSHIFKSLGSNEKVDISLTWQVIRSGYSEPWYILDQQNPLADKSNYSHNCTQIHAYTQITSENSISESMHS